MDDKVKSLYDALGAIAEMCAIFNENLIKQSFTPEQSLELTKTFLVAQISAITRQSNGEGD